MTYISVSQFTPSGQNVTGYLGLSHRPTNGSVLLLDQLFYQAKVSALTFGLWLGESPALTLGGVAPDHASSKMAWTKLKSKEDRLWKVPMDSIKLGDVVISSSASHALIDSSVPYIMMNE